MLPAMRVCRGLLRSAAAAGRRAARRIGLSRVPSGRGFCAGSGEVVRFTFVEDGENIEVEGRVGQSLLEVAHDNEVELEGACDSQLACSTCHVILPESQFERLEEPCDEEMDMLDLALGLEDTSRLGCQVKVDKEMEGMIVQIPPSADIRG